MPEIEPVENKGCKQEVNYTLECGHVSGMAFQWLYCTWTACQTAGIYNGALVPNWNINDKMQDNLQRIERWLINVRIAIPHTCAIQLILLKDNQSFNVRFFVQLEHIMASERNFNWSTAYISNRIAVDCPLEFIQRTVINDRLVCVI